MSDDTFMEKIQSYLKFPEYCDIVKDPKTLEWIERTVDSFDSDSIPSQQVANFCLKLLSLICSNEWQFALIKDRKILEKIHIGIEKHLELQKPAIKLSHIVLLHSISEHSIGLHYLKQTRSWKLAINYYETSNTMFIIREAGNFLFNIITKFTELMKDENLCEEIIEAIMAPIIKFRGSEQEAKDQINLVVDDEKLSKEMVPSLGITNHLLTMCIESNKRSRMAYLILLKHRYENKIWQIMDLVQNNCDFLTILTLGLSISNFARLSSMDIPPSDAKAVDLPFDVHTIHFYNLMMGCLNRRTFKNINLIAELHHQLWFKLGDRAPKEVVLENQDLKFGDQVIMVHMLPLVCVIKSRHKHNYEYIDEFCIKMFNMSCEHTIRLLYHYRDALRHESIEFASELATNAIQRIVSIKNCLNRERALLAFQILIFALRGIVDDDSETRESEEMENGETSSTTSKCNEQLLLQCPNLLSALLDGLNVLIKTYNFTWKECIEGTSIGTMLLTLLDNPNLNSRQTVESVKLIQTSIEHALAPNLALLLDKMEGSGMERLGPTIYKRLHDNSWEVRDSVLELLHSIVVISKEKFPPFQRHILENKICQIVETIARNDSEPYVRASAFKVLASMIKIKTLWDHALHELDTKKCSLAVLGNECEGVVRREAVACIVAVYRYQQIPPSCLDIIFSVLAHCAVNDLHWEVKVNALDFWSVVICRQFTHQGMIDGTFPTVTFSKEHKKIITLNDKEIQLRLQKVLNELSLRGCLGVLIACLQDSDLEVIKRAVKVVQKLRNYLNKYNFVEEYSKKKTRKTSTPQSPVPVIDINYSEFSSSLADVPEPGTRNNADFRKTTEVCMTVKGDDSSLEKCDMMIESIVHDQDYNLLCQNYKANLDLKCTGSGKELEMGEIDKDLFKKFASVTADQFLDFITATDFDVLIESKSTWLQHSEDFSSLLDDVLQSFGSDIDLDCY